MHKTRAYLWLSPYPVTVTFSCLFRLLYVQKGTPINLHFPPNEGVSTPKSGKATNFETPNILSSLFLQVLLGDLGARKELTTSESSSNSSEMYIS